MQQTIVTLIVYLSGLLTGVTLTFEYAMWRIHRKRAPFPDNVIMFRNKRRRH